MSSMTDKVRPFVVRYSTPDGARTKAEFPTFAAASAFRSATPGASGVEHPEVPMHNHPGIFRRGDAYVVRYRKGNGKTSRKSCATLAEARRFQTATKRSVQVGEFIDPKDQLVTFEVWATKWIAGHPGARSTRRRWAGIIRNHLLPTFGDKLLGGIRTSDVREWLNAQRDKGLKASTIKLNAEVLASVLKAAVGDRLIPVSPCDGVVRPKVSKAVEVVLADEQVAAIAAALPERYRLAVWLGAMAGLRIGETFGLTYDHIDFERNRLRINRSWKEDATLGTTKTSTARWVPAPEYLMTLIADHVDRFGLSNEGTLFRSEHNERPLSLSSFRHNVWTAVKPLGLPKGASTPHALRHFYASTLIHAGVDIKTVQVNLGHANIAMTLDKYAHMMPGSEDRVRDVFAGRFAPGLRVVA